MLTAGIEWVQQFIPSRVSDARDIVSNSLGAAIGVVITLIVAAARQRARHSPSPRETAITGGRQLNRTRM
jgi:VanZ family protein